MAYRVKKGEQVKRDHKVYTEGQLVAGLSREEAALIPWAVEEGAKPVVYEEEVVEESPVGEIPARASRAQLNEVALSLGVEDPASLPSKAAVRQAIDEVNE